MAPFGLGTVFTDARFPLVPTVAIVVTTGLYAYGVQRLRTRGDAWSWARVAAWLTGELVLAVALVSGLEAYDTRLFGVHMVQHMLLAMVAPVFLALGAPVTLALRTLPARSRRALLSVLHSRLARVVTFPAIPWLLFVVSPFALYFSGWYAATLDNRALHDLLHLHFVLVGCLFFWPIIGVDPVPGKVSHPFRILMLFATMPFHAFLGVAIMTVDASGKGLLAPQHYRRLLDLPDAVFQQQVGGGLIWASGDIVGLLFIGVAVVQWMQASEREAAREDRRLDRLEAAQHLP
ncbi:MAG: Cytochrome c oxidase caa3 assembly factor (Caa3 CtaG) [Frankiales bacterium]|nr:Cytochrome c oxidase caa3 assembly factor (Caa3 CtaG) [Frankiales bacterium]